MTSARSGSKYRACSPQTSPLSDNYEYLDIPLGDAAPDAFNVVVEIPKGSANKYEYDRRLNGFRLDRTLYKELEGKKTETHGWRGGADARQVILAASRKFDSGSLTS